MQRQRPDTHTHWRQFLTGEYSIHNADSRSKMKHDIRKRATRLMEDLLLIATSQQLSKKDKTLIFKNLNEWKHMPEKDKKRTRTLGETTNVWQNVTKPLIRELINNSAYFSEESKELEIVRNLYSFLAVHGKEYGLKFNLYDLINDPDYRQRKLQQINSNEYALRRFNAIKNSRTAESPIQPISKKKDG